jgi:hypothetical protein
VKSARRVVEAVKASRGYEAVERTGRDYARRLRTAYVARVGAVEAAAQPAKRAAKRKSPVRTTVRRAKRAA